MSLATHSGFAAPSHAASAIYGRRTTRKHPFPNSKNLGGGNLKNMQKVFLAGRSGRFAPARRRSLCFLAFFLKIGSSGVVKFHQYFTHILSLYNFMKQIYRTDEMMVRYDEYYRQYKPSENCAFCDRKNRKLISNNKDEEYLYVAENDFKFSFWDMQEVVDHLLIIPVRHISCMSKMNNQELDQYLHLIEKYSKLGYDIFIKSSLSEAKTMEHLHIHLIKTKGKNLNLSIEYFKL